MCTLLLKLALVRMIGEVLPWPRFGQVTEWQLFIFDSESDPSGFPGTPFGVPPTPSRVPPTPYGCPEPFPGPQKPHQCKKPLLKQGVPPLLTWSQQHPPPWHNEKGITIDPHCITTQSSCHNNTPPTETLNTGNSTHAHTCCTSHPAMMLYSTTYGQPATCSPQDGLTKSHDKCIHTQHPPPPSENHGLPVKMWRETQKWWKKPSVVEKKTPNGENPPSCHLLGTPP